MVSLKGKFELADLKNAQNLHARPGRWGMILIFTALGLLVLMLLWGLVFTLLGQVSWNILLLPLLVLVVAGLFWFGLRPYQIARAYQQHKELSSDFEMELTEAGYHIQNSYGTGTIPWKDFAKWKADKNVILLYRTDTMFNLVPKRLLQDEGQAQYVVDQLEQNGVREASKVKNPVRRVTSWVLYGGLAVVILIVIYLNTR